MGTKIFFSVSLQLHDHSLTQHYAIVSVSVAGDTKCACHSISLRKVCSVFLKITVKYNASKFVKIEVQTIQYVEK